MNNFDSCVRVVCGNGLVEAPAEECDDGNDKYLDGCSANCKIEQGYVCINPGRLCAPSQVCGNGIRENQEACDDGNQYGGDGCDSNC